MTYAVGQKMHLVKTVQRDGIRIVTEELIVKITATNNTQKPVFVDDEDGKRYHCFNGRWRPRGEPLESGGDGFTDIVNIYNDCASKGIPLVDEHGNNVYPNGDTWYCKDHDRYWHEGDECLRCRSSSNKAVA